MPRIHPFPAWHYNPERIGDLGKVISPPYDVISPSDRSVLAESSPHHFVHLILPEGSEDEKYQKAAAVLEQWTNTGTLIQDRKPAIYILEQTFKVQGEVRRRTGIVCELELEPLGTGVLAHEKTIPKHVTDRYRLLAATHANTGQIFMSYQDDNREVEKVCAAYDRQKPEMDFTIDEVRYRIRAIRDRKEIYRIQSVLKRTPAIIADGHHRYQTALQYFQDYPKQPGSDRVMVTLVNAADPGMQVLPTHRIIASKREPDEVLKHLKPIMHIETLNNVSEAVAILSRDKQSFGLCYGPGRQSWLLTPRTVSTELDVVVFHQAVLPAGFGLDTRTEEGLARLTYLRGTSDPRDFLVTEKFKWLGLIRPPTLEQVFQLAGRRQMMPQKSTYFFPKVYSGFLFRRF